MQLLTSANQRVAFRIRPVPLRLRTRVLPLRARRPAGFALAMMDCRSQVSEHATRARFTLPGVRGAFRMRLRSVRLADVGWPYCGTRRWRDPVGVFPITGG